MSDAVMEKQASIPEIGKTVSVNGVRTNYHEQGEGPPLLLIHGSGPGVTAWANWRANLPEFAKEFHVYAPDMIGFGYTDAPAGGIKEKQVWIDHLAGFLDAMGIEKASLVGNSFGGALTIAFMIAHPDRVDRAVLMGAAGVEFPITEALDFVWGYEPSMEMMRKTIAYLSTDPSRITESLIESRYEASRRPAAHEPYAATFGPKPRQNHLKMLCSSEEQVAAIQHEVLILHGKLDRVIPLEVSERLVKLIKNSDLHAFGNCGHWVQIERAASFNRLVTQFVKQGLNG